MPKKLFTIIIVFALMSSAALACSGCAKTDEGAMKNAKMQPESSKKVETHGEMQDHSSQMNMGGTMAAVFSAEKLYTCPMHAEVIAADATTKCPLCKMKLNELSTEKTTELRAAHPVGCTMDPIAVSGSAKLKNCPVCKMDLTKIEQTEVHDHG